MKLILGLILQVGLIGFISPPRAVASDNRFWGEPMAIGTGQVNSWVEVDHNRRLKAIGLSIDAVALQNLPTEYSETILKLPRFINTKPFENLASDWEPHGHEPAVYALPHFDFHFYMISVAKRMRITCAGSDRAKCLKPVDPAAIASDYVGGPEGVPMMGWHFVDITSPEFHGQIFTSTLIYGYYGGRMTFIEPMVTLAFLQSKPQFSMAIKQPTKYPESGFYPMRYSVYYHYVNDQYEVSLNQMVYRR